MADNGWQLEAIHEQFEVFNDLKPPRTIELFNSREVISTTQSILRKHLRHNSIIPEPARKICAEILKTVPESKFFINLSYIVIVTNQETNNKLSKIPVFVVAFDNKNIFIDITSTVYNSWEAYKSSNNLPACKFCFPVDGRYNVGGKLSIDFASSPATKAKSSFWHIIGSIVVVAATVAGSYLFKIPQKSYKFVKDVSTIVQPYLPRINEAVSFGINFSKLIQNLKNGNISTNEFFVETVKIFQLIQKKFQKEIDYALEEVRRGLFQFYVYLKRKFRNFFDSAPPSSQHEFAAIVSKVDCEVNSSNAKIFENCRDEYSFHGKSKNYEASWSSNVSKTTDDLVTISTNIANALNGTNDVKLIFQSLGSVYSEELQKEIRQYRKIVEAARVGAGHDIDIEAFNKTLGIDGNVEEHFKRVVIQNLQKSRLLHRLQEKIYKMQEEKKIEVIVIWKKQEDSSEGLYKCVGLSGAGKFSAKDVINMLKEDMAIRLDEKHLVLNETGSLISISYKKLSILVHQEINEENTSEGLMYILKGT